jgi:hypothetical protein
MKCHLLLGKLTKWKGAVLGNILNTATLSIFLFYVVPGVVATKVYRVLNPADQKNYADYMIELVTFSMFYLALFFWLVALINQVGIRANSILYNFLVFLTIFVIPALLGYVGSLLTKASWLRKLARTLRHPTPTGWDYVFQQPRNSWVLFHLKSGKLIGGYYDHMGFVSSYPQAQEIYISQFWRVSDDGKFLTKVDRTAGGIIRAEECTFIEFFEA